MKNTFYVHVVDLIYRLQGNKIPRTGRIFISREDE